MASRPLIGIPMIPQTNTNEPPGMIQRGWRKYAAMLYAEGALPVHLPLLEHGDPEAFLEPLDGLLLPGGGDVDPALFGEAPHPDLGEVIRSLDDFEIALARLAMAADLPTLGICRGSQVWNVALGGTLIQHIPAQIPNAIRHGDNPAAETAHAIEVAPGSRLESILGPGPHMVNSTHHQAVKDVAPGLRVCAVCPDDGAIEAIECPGAAFGMGVQFHPEELSDRFRPLFAAFVDACRAFRTRREAPRRPSPDPVPSAV